MIEGLTHEAAAARLAKLGPNDPRAGKPPALLLEILRRFANPLVVILIVASVASAILRDFASAAIVLGIVVSSVVIEFVQTGRSTRAAASLRARVAQTATVRRSGAWVVIPREGVVPGDLFRLSAGDLVPADGELVSAKDLHLNEAALTGESLPVEKTVDAQVSMGSSVVSGTATAVVTETGPRTMMGSIAASLVTRPPPSELERGTARFARFILETVLALVLFMFAVTAIMRRDPLESLLFAVALAVGLTPEFLPMISTVTLTRGAVRMADAKVIVKSLSAIQSFGGMNVLCCDKTGTLTTGEMRLDGEVDPLGAPSERALLLGYLNSYFESGVENPLDAATLEKGGASPSRGRASALDVAVLEHAHPDIAGYMKRDEIPFDFERRRVSVVAEREGEGILVTKGAPENVLEVSTWYEVAGERRPLDDAARARCAETSDALGRSGARVLAVAYASVDATRAFTTGDERELVLAGYLAFVDPPRPDSREMLDALRERGVHVKVITGDGELVAKHVCAEVGISTRHVLTGADIDALSDPALAYRAERTHLFARVNPAQKSRIIAALRSKGHVVGFLGDGINDAPALHAADVGISVSSAVDVAKDAAAIILLEPGLRVLLTGVLEGRRAFGNVMKYLLMGTSSNFGNMFSMAAATLFLPFLPMLPKQILLNNFLYDAAQLTIPSDNVDAAYLRKPRRWDIKLIRRFMLVVGPVSSLYDALTFLVLVKVFHASEAGFHTGWFVESLATQTLVLFVIRTASNPFASRPSRALVATALGVVALAVALPYSPVAPYLGFVPLPAPFFAFLVVATVTYLALVEGVKRIVLRRALA